MNKHMHRLAFLLGVGVLLGGLAGCATSDNPQTRDEIPAATNVLRIGITPTLAPIAFQRNGQLAGIEVDLARALAKALGRTPRFIELPWEKQIDALMANQTDLIMSGMSITPARQMRVAFTEPYMRSGQTALVRRSELASLQLTLFTSQHRIGVQPGTTGEYYVQQQFSKAEVKLFKTPAAGAQALIKGHIDAFIHDAPANWWLASVHESEGLTVIPRYLTEEYVAWAARKNDTALVEAANRWIATARKNGELQRLIGHWIPFQ
jgi:polar amino acid transport system substrate-binding protein